MAHGLGRPTLSALLSVSLLGGGSAPAMAQGASVLRTACATDYAAHCTGENPAPGIERACLAQYYINLSQTCQAAVDAAGAAQGAADPAGQ